MIITLVMVGLDCIARSPRSCTVEAATCKTLSREGFRRSAICLNATGAVQVVKLIAYVVVGRTFEVWLAQRLLNVADSGITGAV